MQARASRRRGPGLLCAVIALGIGGPAALDGQQEELDQEGYRQLIQEYFQTTAVYPQEDGEVQVTLLPGYSVEDDGDALGIPFEVEYGLTDRWQVELEWVGLRTHIVEGGRRRSGIGDVELGTQLSFMSIRGSPYHAAAGFGVSLPTGSLERGTTEGFTELEPFLALARDFPSMGGAQLFGEVGLGLVRRSLSHPDPVDDEPAAHELKASGGLMVPAGRARLTAELSWASNRWNNEGEERALFVTPGLTWDFPGTWEVGIAAPVGLAEDVADFGVILIVLYEFELGDEDGSG